MKVKFERKLNELAEVLLNTKIKGDATSYWVFTDVTLPNPTSTKKWINMTIIAPERIDIEFNKTYGHYHPVKVVETYKVLSGKGVLYLQKKHIDKGKHIEDMVDEVLCIRVQPGEEIQIPFEWGHSWINIGEEPLVSVDDWNEPHTHSDYEPIKKTQGMAYYITSGGDGIINEIPNPRYKNHPPVKWVDVKQAKEILGQEIQSLI